MSTNLARMDTNVDGGSVGLLSLDPLDVDPKLAPVALDNLADLKINRLTD